MSRSLKLLSLLAIVFAFAVPAVQASIDDCNLMIETLKFDTQAAMFYGQNADKTEAGLLGKLSGAQTKLSAGKFADAIAKLNDYATQVQTLAATGKLDQTQATTLYDEAQAAIACIQSLG